MRGESDHHMPPLRPPPPSVSHPQSATPPPPHSAGVDEIMTWPGITQWVDSDFGSAEKLKCSILRDFYRHGFDGSGDDGGSCIDGRLTSAWNWCQQLSKKKYFVIFALTGFSSFDGQF